MTAPMGDLIPVRAHTYAASAFSWAFQQRLEEMRRAVQALTREQVLETLRACSILAAELGDRHTELADAELAAVPAGVDGYPIGGRS